MWHTCMLSALWLITSKMNARQCEVVILITSGRGMHKLCPYTRMSAILSKMYYKPCSHTIKYVACYRNLFALKYAAWTSFLAGGSRQREESGSDRCWKPREAEPESHVRWESHPVNERKNWRENDVWFLDRNIEKHWPGVTNQKL